MKDPRIRSWSLLTLLFLTTPTLAEPIVGRAVNDGDTLEVRGSRIRLHGIDAPEIGQTYKDGAGKDYRFGQKSALGVVTCNPRDMDQFSILHLISRRSVLHLHAALTSTVTEWNSPSM